MDPTDTYVAALSGSHSPAVRLELYLLRDKRGVAGPSVTMMKDGRKIGVSYGGAECFQFSSLVKDRVAVGARYVTLRGVVFVCVFTDICCIITHHRPINI